MRAFATRLVAHATQDDESSVVKARTALRVCEQMRPHLATLMGNDGFRALLARALTLAAPQASWLYSVHLNTGDGCLHGCDDVGTGLDAEAITEAMGILVAHLLSLLVAFVGEKLTLRIVRQAWPQLPFDLDLGEDSGNETIN
jgi:hypothetical protein